MGHYAWARMAPRHTISLGDGNGRRTDAAADLWPLGDGGHVRGAVRVHRVAGAGPDRARLGRYDHPALHRLRAPVPLAAGAVVPGLGADRLRAAVRRAAAIA